MEGPTRIGDRVYVNTAGGNLTGTVRAYASTLDEPYRTYDLREPLTVVRMDWSGKERACYQGYVHLFDNDPAEVVIDGRIYTR